MGSPNDREKMAPAVATLGEFGLEVDERVLSAHRAPDDVAAMARSGREHGYAAFICGAGMAAHLAGAVAAHTTRKQFGHVRQAPTASSKMCLKHLPIVVLAGSGGQRREYGRCFPWPMGHLPHFTALGGAGDPPLLASRHGRPVHRRGSPGAV